MERSSSAGPQSKPTASSIPPSVTFLRQMLRLQYQWTLPLEAGCTETIPPVPLESSFTIDSDQELWNMIHQRRLREIRFVKAIFNDRTHSYTINQHGSQYLYQGQGPIWDQNSCHLDCCIVAARLLNVGSTASDMGGQSRESWLSSLHPVPRNFLHLLSEKWESMDRQVNIARRHHFWDNDLPQLVKGTPNRPNFAPASWVWEMCTSRMEQFGFLSRETFSECRHCGAAPTTQEFRSHQSLSLDASRAQIDDIKKQFKGQPSIAHWIGRELGQSRKRCGKCKTPDGRTRKREIKGGLPPRLVVVPGELLLDSISQPTSNNVRFKHFSTSGHEEVTYRWLGGIYCRDRHFRLYWTDEEIKFPKEHIKIYDGLCASGAIIGRVPVPAGKRDEKVPASWSNGPAVLFYERINQEAMSSAAKSLKADFDIALSLESRDASKANFRNAVGVTAQNPSALETEDQIGQDNHTSSRGGPHRQSGKTNSSSKIDTGNWDGESCDDGDRNESAEKETMKLQGVNEDDGHGPSKEERDTNGGVTDQKLSKEKKSPPKSPPRTPLQSSPKSPSASASNAASLFFKLSPSKLLNYLRRPASPPPPRTRQRQRSLPPPDLPQFDGGNDERAHGLEHEYPVSASEDEDDSDMYDDELASSPPSSATQFSSPSLQPPSPSCTPRRSVRISKSRAASPETPRQRSERERVGIPKVSSMDPRPAVRITKGSGDRGRQTMRLESVAISRKRDRSESLDRGIKDSRHGHRGRGAKKVKFG
ncbi:MAG: hypothetical protein LQ352_006112 [Teloschistes flavicans]|nr:MAG: hypothetical protein LQ352_006112 [Teloschistes flavicans]